MQALNILSFYFDRSIRELVQMVVKMNQGNFNCGFPLDIRIYMSI